ncbi:hypothetical protein [Aquimarina brevivitae]|uniref:DUF4185 domain-containing protein n=1 Tax=Aquimarina brevivitae TaxID=323412 RepID=A0A4V2F5S3_9FLAO|nr:hypothetical protein [Aquimarina brevivitae]RZS93819.1 hypothetical protein EV197_2400 [Aquimarina brevivitae]
MMKLHYTLSKTVYLCVAVLVFISCTNDDNKGSTPPNDPQLVTITDFQYQGAFRISSATFGASSSNYSSGPIAYNPDNHSLFIVGNEQVNAIAEFPIPELLDKATLAELNASEAPTQEFTTILNAVANPTGVDRINGMLYKNGQLIINAEKWYDASGTNENTTLVLRDANDLTNTTIDGYYQLNGAANAAGYLSYIPEEWQASFNASYITGWSSVNSIISRYSYGPSLFTFDENDVLNTSASTGPINTNPFLNFSFANGNHITPPSNDPGQDLWNYLSEGIYGFIIPGTRTFAVFGSSGGVDSGIGYKIIQDNGNECGGYCAYQAADYYNYYWFFDLDDILNAENVWDPRPYAYGRFSVPFDEQGEHSIIGATFDSGSGMLYLCLSKAGQMGTYDRPPLIVGYKIQ